MGLPVVGTAQYEALCWMKSICQIGEFFWDLCTYQLLFAGILFENFFHGFQISKMELLW